MDIQKTMQATLGLERDERWLDAFDRLSTGFRFIISYSPDGALAKVEFASPSIERLYGITVAELHRDIDAIRRRIVAEDRETVKAAIARAIADRASACELHYRLQTSSPDQSVRHIRVMATIEYAPDGRSIWYGVAIDVTQENELREGLQHKIQQLQSTLRLLPDLWFELDAQGVYRAVHANDEALLLRPPEELIGRHISAVLPPDVYQRVSDAMFVAQTTGRAQKFRYPQDLPDGMHHFEASISFRDRDDGQGVFTVLVRDQTEIVRIYEAREEALLRDGLTGLWNRAGFMDGALTRYCERSAGAPQSTSLMLLVDVDGLREINHTLGHDAGDRVLRAVAERLPTLSPCLLAARLGGDELVALVELSGPWTDEQCADWVRQAWSTLSAPLKLGDLDFRPSLSVGWTTVSHIQEHPTVAFQEALAQVEEGLFAAKRSGRGRIERFDAERFAHARRRHELAQALTGALTNRELWLAMQPIVLADCPNALAAEALLRWRSPKFGEVSPLQFIPLAERSRAIVAIGEWVLTQACQWAAARPQVSHVSVNISPYQFAQADFVETVERALQTSGLPANRLCLEITESLLADDLTDVARKMHQLEALGVRFALDDFGTGYSNLLQLRSLPLHALKLDRTYIRDVLTDPDDACIVEAVLELAHRLQITVVAEGVETREQSEWLLQRRCDALQGYLYGKPMPAQQWPLQGLPP
ncbi:putative bifunctional diguanylate cyclase/phosphodiesterase [Tepidimonas sp.]|uniref:putative bifunctional diguanylate cyclase/phosphodiesterase n=1 Tax=Tepidimonas sp. TaxID=2002775 RepID=UPI00391DA898